VDDRDLGRSSQVEIKGSKRLAEGQIVPRKVHPLGHTGEFDFAPPSGDYNAIDARVAATCEDEVPLDLDGMLAAVHGEHPTLAHGAGYHGERRVGRGRGGDNRTVGVTRKGCWRACHRRGSNGSRSGVVYSLDKNFSWLERLAPFVESAMTRLDGVTTRHEGAMTPLDGVTTRLDAAMTRLDGVTTRLDGAMTPLDGGMTPLDGAMTPLDGAMTPLDGAMTPLDGAMTPLDGAMTPLDGVATRLDAAMTPLDGAVTPLGGAVTPLDGAMTIGTFQSGREGSWEPRGFTRLRRGRGAAPRRSRDLLRMSIPP